MQDGIKYRIVQQNTKSEWDLYGAIDNYEYYDDLITQLHQATQGDMMVLRINSGGGHADIGFMLVKAIQNSAATVLAHVVWESASMASIIALACDGLLMDKNTNLMFHAYSGGSYGKADDLVQGVNRSHRLLTNAAREIICPFITKKELIDIENGRDKYIEWDDDDLQKRIKRHFKVQMCDQ